MKVRLWQVGGTDKAYLFSTTSKLSGRKGKQIWIPRSIIEHISRNPAKPNDWQECEVTLPEWKIEQLEL